MVQEAICKEIAAAKERLEQVRKADSLVFLTFSDLHTRRLEDAAAQELVEWIQKWTEAVPTDGVVDLGDNLGMLGREDHISNDYLKKVLDDLFGGIQGAANCPVWFINGNHDAIGTDFFCARLWKEILGEKYNRGAQNVTAEGAYYTVDFEAANTRLVFLSVPYASDLQAELPTPCWGFGQKQLQWLAETALNTEKTVLLFCHVPLYYEYHGNHVDKLGVWDGERAREATIAALCGWIEDIGEAEAIFDAFQKGEAYENPALGISLPAGKPGRLAACFSGHTHKDALWLPKEVRGEDRNPLPCKQAIVKSFILDKAAGMDALVWTPSEGKFHLIRVGAGEDREFSAEG